MAVFKDENGVWKPCGCLNGMANPQKPQRLYIPDGNTSNYPRPYKLSTSLRGKLMDVDNVRTDLVSSYGFVPKGGDCEKTLTEN